MNDRLSMDREALKEFISLMDTMAAETAAVLDTAEPLLARTGADAAPEGAYRGGVKLTLGAMNYDHPGRQAGELLSDRIADTLNFVTSLEEGSRALGKLTREVMAALDGQDTIASDELDRINASVPVGTDNPYGETFFGLLRSRGN